MLLLVAKWWKKSEGSGKDIATGLFDRWAEMKSPWTPQGMTLGGVWFVGRVSGSGVKEPVKAWPVIKGWVRA